MKKYFVLSILFGSFLFSSCIKDLTQRGIYETTRCYGVILDSLTDKPLANIRIIATDRLNVDQTVYSNSDGTFEIPIHESKLTSDYYIFIDADSLFQSVEIKVNDLELGEETFNLGKIYFIGASIPKVHTALPDNITTTSARCSGQIEQFGYSEITERGFVYGNMQYPTINNNVVRASGTGDSFSANLTLTPHTTYYVRAYAINGMGVGYGNQVVFASLDGLPEVVTNDISNITPSSASASGHVFSDGGFPVSSRGLCWGMSIDPTIDNLHISNGSDTGYFVSTLTGLHPGRTYYVRAYAQNEAGIAYGANQSFTTPDGLPSVTTSQVSNITSTSATAGGTVVSDSGFPVVRRGICYSTTPLPTTSAPHTTDGVGLGNYVSQMTNLLPATTYYYRAYATNGVGTVYGAQYSFATE